MGKTYFITLVLSSLSMICYAQSGFGVSLIPQFNHIVFEKSELVDGKTTFNLGLRVDFFQKIKWDLEINAGLRYKNLEINQIDYSIVLGCDINSIQEINYSNTWLSDKYSIHYIGVPIELKYRIPNNNFYIKGGIELLYRIGQNNESTITECGLPEMIINPYDYKIPKKYFYQYKLGLGYEKKIFNEWLLSIEPEIGYTINWGIYEELDQLGLTLNSRLLEIGLRLGLRKY